MTQPTMSTEEQKSLGRFLRLAPPRFSGFLGNYEFEFLTASEDRLYGLGLVDSHSVDYPIFQLDLSS